MLSECFNPACRKGLRYLRSGKVVMVLRQGTERTEVEHFWLCGACYVSYDFRFGEDGNPSLITKSPQLRSETPAPLAVLRSVNIRADVVREMDTSGSRYPLALDAAGCIGAVELPPRP